MTLQPSKGTLLFINSKNPPVFGREPIMIEYLYAPKKGEPFLFRRTGSKSTFNLFSCCNLSTVQKVSRFAEFSVIKTLNSSYVLFK